jgi:Flp pilus assembly secretin CpaC
MKKLLLILLTIIPLFAKDVVVFNNEYKIFELDKKVQKLLIGNREMINVSVLSKSSSKTTTLKIFGKKSGNTSILVKYRDGSLENYHVYVNENLGFVQKMINIIEPELILSRVGNGATVMSGSFKDPHTKHRIYSILDNSGIDMKKLMDVTETKAVNKMVRTKLYLVEINNQKAKDLGGITGLSFFSDYLNLSVNPLAGSSATFSGWLLDNAGALTQESGTSVSSTLNFLEQSGIGKILDDTVLMTTEDENASFRVGGEVYIPIGITQNTGFAPTLQLEEREYGLELGLTSSFMEKEGFIHINVNIVDSEFDTNIDHEVSLGDGISVPAFISKNITTNVVVQSGQVVALGGRMHTEDYEKEEKIPFLGDIPYLGELFTHTITVVNENDLLFFLVPEIVDANKDIDDTKFYKNFKQKAKLFHQEAYEINSTKEEIGSLVVLDDTKLEKTKEHVVNDGIVVIEVEDEGQNIDDNSIYKEVLVKESIPTPKVSKEKIVLKKVAIEEKEQKTKTMHEVTRDKVFLRERPIDGKRIKVWTLGHKFTVGEQKEIDGNTWMQIQDNCLNECKKEDSELWISSSVTKKI